MKELTKPEIKRVAQVAKELFEDMSGDPTYPFKTWDGQYDELISLIKKGEMTMDYINSAAGYDA